MDKITQMQMDILKLLELISCCSTNPLVVQDASAFWDEVDEVRSRYIEEDDDDY